jgi:hypothetical protein
MAQARTSDGGPAAARAARGLSRLRAAWRGLSGEQRLAAFAALALLLTMFLPWYSTAFTAKVTVAGKVATGHDHQTAIGAFSWVEAAVLLVALGVLLLLFARGERRAFHLPGGDGAVITAAGLWACVLIVWRFFDKPDLGQGVSVGLQWGIFVALIAAGALALAGNNVRAAHRPEPPLEPEPEPRPPGEPVEFRIPESRPHLEETRVMGDRAPAPQAPKPAPPPGAEAAQPQTPAARRTSPLPLSRETAAQDTADFRAVPPAPDQEETQRMGGEETQRMGDEETHRMGEDDTRPLPPPGD